MTVHPSAMMHRPAILALGLRAGPGAEDVELWSRGRVRDDVLEPLILPLAI